MWPTDAIGRRARNARLQLDAARESRDRSLDAPRKQRHTARRIWQRLVAEHGAVLTEQEGAHQERPGGVDQAAVRAALPALARLVDEF